MSPKNIIAVVGATGAQGMAVIDALLAPASNGSASPYAVRGLTRNAQSKRAKSLTDKEVEVVEGSIENADTLVKLFDGAYGAFVNTDTYSVGEERELFVGIKAFERAKRTSSMKHYVWSSLDYVMKSVNFNEKYSVKHYDTKGRVAEYMRGQDSSTTEKQMAWSILTTGPYMDQLNGPYGPINVRKDGTSVFAVPIGQGHVPMITLQDLGFWTRYVFDNPEKTSAQELKVASDMVSLDYLVKTFAEVTGKPAVSVSQTIEEWWNNFIPEHYERPVFPLSGLDNKTTWKQNFSGFFRLFRDDVVLRDMDWIKSVHPGTQSLADWMRKTNYDGISMEKAMSLLKNVEDGQLPFAVPRAEVTGAL